MRFESQFSRMNCQTFSCGFSSGHFAGNGMSVMLGGRVRRQGQAAGDRELQRSQLRLSGYSAILTTSTLTSFK